jgi:hypothetical protein
MRFVHRSDRRLHLRRPAPALFSMWPVKIVDASVSGLGVAHGGELKPGDNGTIEFVFARRRFTLAVTVLHSRPASGKYPVSQQAIEFRSGLTIRERNPYVLDAYRRIVNEQLNKISNAEALMPSVLPDVNAD